MGECVRAVLVDGEMVHVGARLIRAEVSWESLGEAHVEQDMVENKVETESGNETESKPRRRPGRPRTRPS